MDLTRISLRESFFRNVGQTSSAPIGLKVDKADGVFLYSDGEKYLDFVSGVSVSNVGHSNKEVVEAVKAQVDNYFHLMVYGEMIQAPQVLHATLLASLLPDPIDNVFYVNSGSEANEAALKLAKRYTGRTQIISMKNAYHGSSHGVLSVMGSEFFKTSYRPLLPDVDSIEFNNFADLDRISSRTACVIVEPVQAEAGVIQPADGYLQALRKRCDDCGTLLIFDEVQTGFGRLGAMFACLKYDVVPDIVTFAKALGGGLPLGALCSSKKIMDAFQTNPILGHITTFGGHPVSCAAALASLKVLMREDWISQVEKKSAFVKDYLSGHPKVREIRNAGLLIAVDLGNPDYAARMIPLLFEEKIISDYFLFNPTSFRIAPPLCITMEELEYGLKGVLRALDKL